jgi:hypothetical protein
VSTAGERAARVVRRSLHLAGGFVRALWPFGPSAATEAWVAGIVTDAEHRCWARMPRRDRREGVRTARRLVRRAEGVDDQWIAAALLHDCGKRESTLGPYGRAVATVVGALAGPEWPDIWIERDGFTRSVGLYLRHAPIGAGMLRVAGARETVALWAEAHHARERYAELGMPPGIPEALAAADGEVA